MDFTVSITDPASLAGITWAREQRNAAVPLDENSEPTEPLCADDAAYVQWVMERAAASYAEDQALAEARSAYEATR